MASAADYVFNRAPTVADFPQFNGNWISDLPGDYWKGQQYGWERAGQTAFANGIPRRPDGSVDTDAIASTTFKYGGAAGAAPIAGRMINYDLYRQTTQGRGGVPLIGDDGQSIQPGSFPHAILGQESNYGTNNTTSQTGNIGPGQISKDLFGKYAKDGEDIYNNEHNVRVTDRISRDYLKKYNGDWARAAVAYYSGEGNVAPVGSRTPWKVDRGPRPGVAGPKTSQYVAQIGARMSPEARAGGGFAPQQEARNDQLNPKDRASVDAMYGQPGAAQPGTGAPAPVEQPKGATGNAPFMASSSQQGAGPANIGGGVKVASTDTAVGTNQEGSPNSTAERASVSGGGTDTSSPPPPSSNSPNNRAVAQGPSGTTGQEVGEANFPSWQYTPAYSAALRKRAQGKLDDAANREAYGVPGAADVRESAKQDFERAGQIDKALEGRSQEQFKAGIERGQKQFEVGLARETAAINPVQAAKGKRMADVIERAPNAQKTIQTLDTIEDAVKHGGDNITFGPGHEFWLEVKRGVANIFPNTQIPGLAEADTIQKMNAVLASMVVKQMTNRPTQYEFKQFQQNNPGLMTSRAGTLALIDILRQNARQDIDLAGRAMRTRNPDDWGDTEDNYYKTNHLISPLTGRPMNEKDQAQAPQYRHGDTAVNKKTGQRAIFIEGKGWQIQ